MNKRQHICVVDWGCADITMRPVVSNLAETLRGAELEHKRFLAAALDH
jgi:hypothetical protein